MLPKGSFFCVYERGEYVKTVIEVSCIDQDLLVEVSPLIASGGRHENYVSFSFCSKWEGFNKTAVFYRNIKDPYYAILDDSNMCEIPHEVTDNKGIFYFGVIGTSGEVVRTSKILMYQVKQGGCSSELIPTDPTPDIWAQLIGAYSEVLEKVEQSNQDQRDFISDANKAVENCNTATNDCYAAINMLNYQYIDLDGGDPSMEDVIGETNDVDGGAPY